MTQKKCDSLLARKLRDLSSYEYKKIGERHYEFVFRYATENTSNANDCEWDTRPYYSSNRRCSFTTKTWDDWRDNIINKYDNDTEGNLDELFNHWN